MNKSKSEPKSAASEIDENAKKAKPPANDKSRKKPAKKAKAEKVKAEKVKAEKVVRDSFTMPKSDYALIDTLKKKCLASGVAVKKSELLRAGLAALHGMPGESLLVAVKDLAQVKTGRPPSTKKKKPA